jgi:threonyl-tRNA synthetase
VPPGCADAPKAAGEELTVRVRGEKEQPRMALEELEELAERIRAETKGMPYRPLPLPVRPSRRVIFFG